jgi:hypothetical protein
MNRQQRRSFTNRRWQNRIGWEPPTETPILDAVEEETVEAVEVTPADVEESTDMNVQVDILLSKNAKDAISEIKSGLWDGFRDLLLARENERAKPRKTVIAAINTLDNLA